MAFAIERGAEPEGRWTTADKRPVLATKLESARLCVPQGRPLLRVLRLRQTQGRNDLVETTVMSAGTAGLLASSGLAEERLSIVPAPEWVAKLLDIPRSTPVLKLDRIVRTPSGTPLEWRLTYSPTSTSGGGSGLRRKLRAQNC